MVNRQRAVDGMGDTHDRALYSVDLDCFLKVELDFGLRHRWQLELSRLIPFLSHWGLSPLGELYWRDVSRLA